MKSKCSVCGCDLMIEIFPDYASSGMWCATCGVSYGDPKASLKMIPPELSDMVDGWNLMWEMAMEDKNLNKENFIRIFNVMGNELARQINEYVQCFYDDSKPVYY